MVVTLKFVEVVLTCESTNEILNCGRSSETATEQYFPAVLFIMLYKLVLTFKTVDEIFKCKLLSTEYFPVVLFIMLYKVVLTFESVDEIPKV